MDTDRGEDPHVPDHDADRERVTAELTKAMAALDSIFEASPVAMFVLDGTTNIVRVNAAAVLLCGGTETDIVQHRPGNALRCVHSSQDPRGCGYSADCLLCPARNAIERLIASGDSMRGAELVLDLVRDGTLRRVWMCIGAEPVDLDGCRHLCLAMQDITARKHAEEELRCEREHLEVMVTERTSQLEAANKELEAFAYSVSHDLRAPLRAIEGFSAIVINDYGSQLDPEGQRLLGVVRANAARMSVLIDNLLTFSRTGRSELKHGRIDMEEMGRAVFAEVLVQPAALVRIDFSVGALPPADGDSGLVRQVWVNLLSNAVKFTSKRERAGIQVTGALDGDQAVYCVRDNGVGFDMQYAGKLFGVFQRLHSPDQFEGTGIGLALVKRIVARHGGRVWAEAEAGRGAAFFFTLPAAGAEDT